MLQLGDSFYSIFKDKIQVSEIELQCVFETPDRVQTLENGVTLYIKEFTHDVKSHLLLCSQLLDSGEVFAFCFWIPKDLIDNKVDLLDTLILFSNLFGVKLKVGDSIEFFIKYKERMLNDFIQSPYEVAELLCSNIIPVDLFVFYNQNKIGSLNRVQCYYCFAINHNKYLLWLYQLKTNKVLVPASHTDYITDIVASLNPIGYTKLLIKTPFKKQRSEINSQKNFSSYNNLVEVSVPEKYLRVIEFISTALQQLEEGQKILVIPQEKQTNCVFCDSQDLTDEHIIPKWTREFFERKSFDAITMSKADDEELLSSMLSGMSSEKWDSYGITVNNVCKNCNNNWLSQLEDKVKSILVRDGKLLPQINIDHLTDIQVEYLVVWIIIKSLLLSLKTNIPSMFNQSVFKGLKENIIPEEFLVEITSFDDYDLNYTVLQGSNAIASRFRLDKFDKEAAKKYENNFFQCCLHFGNIIFRVSYWDEKVGLKRENSMKRTKVLYPKNYKLSFYNPQNLDELFDKIEKESKLNIFSNSLSLTDFKI